MKLDIKQIIKQSGEHISQTGLAKEMVEDGIFKNLHSAINMLQYHSAGKSKSVDYALLKWLCIRFNRKGSDIIQWDE
jgi:hypothetical protein